MEGLGLAYQASKPLEDRSYDIVSNQLAYIEQKKGAEEAAKRQAELERRKAQAKFLESNKDLLQPKEAVGWYSHNQDEVISQMQGIVFKAGELMGNGQVTEAYALTAAAKDSVEEIQRLSKLFSTNPEMAAKEIYGEDFIVSPELNKQWMKVYDDFQKGNMSFQIKGDGNLGLYKMTEDGNTVEVDPGEISYVMSQPLKSAVEPIDWALSIAKDLNKEYKTGTKNNNKVQQCWDCETPDGYINLKQSAERLFNADNSKINPSDHLLTYAVRQYNINPDDVSNMSDEEFNSLKEEFIENTVRPVATETNELNYDEYGDRKDEADIANTYNAMKNRDAATDIKQQNADTSRKRADEYIRRGQDENDEPLYGSVFDVSEAEQSDNPLVRMFKSNDPDFSGKAYSIDNYDGFVDVKTESGKIIPLQAFSPANDGTWRVFDDATKQWFKVSETQLDASVGKLGITKERYILESEKRNAAQRTSGGASKYN